MLTVVLETMHGLGIHEESESIPWREALGVVGEYTAAQYLRGIRYRENLTQKQLAELTGISACHISAMENGKRPIGKQNARKLAEALHIDLLRLLTM